MELPLDGLVQLGVVDQRTCLVHLLTSEQKWLPGRLSRWRLGEDDQGDLMLLDQQTGMGERAAECFHGVVVLDPEDESLYVAEGDTLQTYDDFMGKHDPLDVGLVALGSEVCKLRVWRFRRPNGGSWCWWSLPDIHRGANSPSHSSASKWYHAWWPWWTKYLKGLGFDSPHFRRATPTAQSTTASEEKNSFLEQFGRVLPSYSLSTAALMLLLPRWACSTSRGYQEKGKEGAKKWYDFLDLLLASHVHTGEWKLKVYLDPEVQMLAVPNFSFSGVHPTELRVSAVGEVDLRPLGSGPALSRRLHEACNTDTTVKLTDLCISWSGPKLLNFAYCQLMCQIAARIEAKIHPTEQAGRKEVKKLVQPGAHGMSLGKFGKSMQQQLQVSRKSRMLQYLLAGREHFDGKLLSISGGCDAGRFGHRSCSLTVVCEPGGVAMWAPPVVLGPTTHPHPKCPVWQKNLNMFGCSCCSLKCYVNMEHPNFSGVLSLGPRLTH